MNMMDRGKYSGDNWAVMTPVEQKEVESQGFSLSQDDTIVCGNCGKQLLQIIKVKETDEHTAIRADCPYCNDSSFWHKTKGKIYIQPKDGLYIDEAPIDTRNGIRYSHIKLGKTNG